MIGVPGKGVIMRARSLFKLTLRGFLEAHFLGVLICFLAGFAGLLEIPNVSRVLSLLIV